MTTEYKYCSYYSCQGYLIPADFEGDTCPHCNHKQYSWDRDWIKPLPPKAYEIEMKCRKCESTEDLRYIEERVYSTFSMGNEFECRSCKEAWDAEHARQEAMNYIVINPDDDEIDFYDTKEDVENMFEKFLENYYYEGHNPFEDWVILKVEKLEKLPKKKDFANRNMIHYDCEWYRVEEVIEPEYEYSGDHSVSW